MSTELTGKEMSAKALVNDDSDRTQIRSEPSDGQDLVYLVPESQSEKKDTSIIAKVDTEDHSKTVLSDRPPLELDPAMSPSMASTEAIEEPIQLTSVGRLPLGTTLGHFKITNYIGGGGMGCVYEGIDTALDRKVAVKVLPQQRAQDRASVARFLNEAKSAARLNHEHIAQVYFCGEERGVPFIAFEYVEGINVRSYVQEHGRIPLHQAINFILQMAGALAHASMHGVTHRDVKPSNILITPHGDAKLIDMGLARLLKPTDPDIELTASGVTLGTFDYISPEQARDPREADVRSDIYSLGCTFFYMLAGQPPFPEGTVLQKLLMHQGDEPPDIRTYTPDIPVEIAQVIQKMMAKNPKNRFQAPKALIDVLVSIAEAIGLRPTGPEKTEWEIPVLSIRTRMLRHIPWILSIILLFVSIYVFQFFTVPTDDNNILPTLVTLPVPVTDSSTIPGTTKTEVPEGTRKTGTELPVPDPLRKIPAIFVRVLTKEKIVVKMEENSTAKENSKEISPEKTVDPIRAKNIFDIGINNHVLGGFDIIPVDSFVDFDKWNAAKEDREQVDRAALFLGINDVAQEVNWTFGLSGEPQSTNGTAVPVVQKTVQPSVLTVDLIGKEPGTFSSLASAVSAVKGSETESASASQESVIELKFNGPLTISALSIIGRKIRITSAPGFRPILTFAPSETASGSGERMFLLNSSTVSFENVNIDFTVPTRNIISAEWSVFDFIKENTLTLNQSVITVNNSVSDTSIQARHGNVVVFRMNTLRNDFSANTGSKPSSVVINRSLLRGEAHLLFCRLYSLQNFDINASLINISGYMIHYEDTKAQDRELERMELNVKNSLAILHSSMIFHNQKEGFRPLFPMTVNLSNSILKMDDIPLIASLSNFSKGELVDSSSWIIDRTIFLNVSGSWRHRKSTSPDSYTDESLENQTSLHLDNISTSAKTKIGGTAPHLFQKEDFRTSLGEPLLKGNLGENDLAIIKSLEPVLK